MAITLTFKQSGVPITTTIDHQVSGGSIQPGQTTDVKSFTVEHNAINQIFDCKVYMLQFADSYTGSNTAVADFAELLEWGGRTPANTLGYLISFDNGSTFNSFKTSYGDTQTNAVILPTSVPGITVTGEIPPSTLATLIHKIGVPSDETVGGKRQFSLGFVFKATT